MISTVEAFARFRALGRWAGWALLLFLSVASAPVQPAGALERSSTAFGWLRDGGVHFLGELNGELYFISQFQLWKSNGTALGTVKVSDANPLRKFQQGICPVAFTFFGRAVAARGLLFLSADDGVHGQELWRSDGTTANTAMVTDLNPSGSTSPFNFVAAGTNVYFITPTSANDGLWKSDGTAPGTSFLDGQARPFATLDGTYLFEVDGDLFRSDGTVPGTVQIATLNPSGSAGPTQLAKNGGRVFFVASANFVASLWVTDGTPAGTVQLIDPVESRSVMTCNGGLCYSFSQTGQSLEVWTTDGTPAGTNKVTTLADDSIVIRAIVVNGTVYFLTATRLWKTDGTVAGTQALVSDSQRRFESLTSSGNDLFFIASIQNTDHRELWRSNGTAAGTAMVADFGSSPNFPYLLSIGDTVLVGAWGQVLRDNAGVSTINAWRVQTFDRASGQLVTLADIAHDALHCPTPTCSCGAFTPDPSEVVGGRWFFQAYDPVTLSPRLGVVAKVYFRDVAPDYWAFSWIERLANAGLTTGCDVGTYCPEDPLSRAHIAVFLLRGIHGPSFTPPPATGQVFSDVPADFWAAPWIEQLAAEGLTGGCGTNPPAYCPEGTVTRAQMAILLLRAKHGAGFQPPPATGTMFADVPSDAFAAAWIEELAREGITGGCDTGPARYCPDQPVTRAQMAVFLVRTFQLP